jgi:demethylmenaquinone methyltransferase/2-methoxy-6-polyprenyl-1,4-benzoquinol methylase
MDLPRDAHVLDVAAGTGAITRLLDARGWRPIALDITEPMLRRAAARGLVSVRATADRLPFGAATFDGLTCSYLLRYVPDPLETLRELGRVLRPGGAIGMVEFGRPRGIWGPWWTLYTRLGLPLAGSLIGHGWGEVARFLGPSIDAFHRRFPPAALLELWQQAGFTDVRVQSLSLGGGLVLWARKR